MEVTMKRRVLVAGSDLSVDTAEVVDKCMSIVKSRSVGAGSLSYTRKVMS